MNNAWKQGAPNATFKGIKQPDFQAKIDDAAARDQDIEDLEAQIKIKKAERDAAYQSLNTASVDIRDGVEGHADYGKNHPLYTSMGFTSDEDRKSGLTRKKKESPGVKV